MRPLPMVSRIASTSQNHKLLFSSSDRSLEFKELSSSKQMKLWQEFMQRTSDSAISDVTRISLLFKTPPIYFSTNFLDNLFLAFFFKTLCGKESLEIFNIGKIGFFDTRPRYFYKQLPCKYFDEIRLNISGHYFSCLAFKSVTNFLNRYPMRC